MSRDRVRLLLAAAALAAGASATAAAPVHFFGAVDAPALEPLGVVNGTARHRVAPSGDALAARTAWADAVTRIALEDFEDETDNDDGFGAPLGLEFRDAAGDIVTTADIRGGLQVDDLSGAGRRPVSGQVFAETLAAEPGSAWMNGVFRIEFAAPVHAFGFYATDIGDFGGSVFMKLANGLTGESLVHRLPTATAGAPDGAVHFYGLVDPDRAWTSVGFATTLDDGPLDRWGLDDLMVAELPKVPLPGALPIALAGLGALAGARLLRRPG